MSRSASPFDSRSSFLFCNLNTCLFNSDPDSTMGNGGHTALVVSLSQQIADLDAELTEANQEIARLRALQGQQHLTQEM